MAKSNIQNQEVVHYIALKENKANPDALSIKLGEIVQFNSKDEGYHNITQGEGNDFEKNHGHYEDSIDSGKFGPDEAYRVQIKKIGVYHFHDHLNPDIYATVIVTN